MSANRREIIQSTLAFAVRLALGGASAGTLSSCDGGGGSGQSSSPPQTSAIPTIKAISNSTPQALSAFTITTKNVDVEQPFTVTLAPSASGSSGGVNLAPIRTTADGTIVLAAPIHIDSATGDSADLPARLTITQSSQTSTPVFLTIAHLPTSAELGISLGQVARAFYNYQELVIAGNINALQALALIQGGAASSAAVRTSTASKVQRRAASAREGVRRQKPSAKTQTGSARASSTTPASLLTTAQAQLTNTIMARSDVDRIVADNSVAIPITTAPDGTAVSFTSQSVDFMDRVLAQYLVSIYGPWATSEAGSELKMRLRADHPDSASISNLTYLTNAIGTLTGAAGAASSAFTLWGTPPSSSDAPTAGDTALAVLSLMQTTVQVGATVVAVGAAVAAAPEIALGASAVLTYASLAGVAISGVSVVNDLYNVATTLAPVINGDATLPQVQNKLEQEGAALLSDSVQTYVQSVGVGGLANAAEGIAGGTAGIASNVWPEVLGGLYEDASASMATLQAAGLLTQSLSLYAQATLGNGNQAAQSDAASTTLGSGQGFAAIDGSVDITNSQGPILSALTGINIEDSAGNVYLQTLADTDGDYTLYVPTDTFLASMTGLVLNAIDPVAGEVLDSTSLDLSGLTAGATEPLPALAGTCNDTDATDPDEDDPDCD